MKFFKRRKLISRILIGIFCITTLVSITGCPGRWPIVIIKGGSGAGEG